MHALSTCFSGLAASRSFAKSGPRASPRRPACTTALATRIAESARADAKLSCVCSMAIAQVRHRQSWVCQKLTLITDLSCCKKPVIRNEETSAYGPTQHGSGMTETVRQRRLQLQYFATAVDLATGVCRMLTGKLYSCLLEAVQCTEPFSPVRDFMIQICLATDCHGQSTNDMDVQQAAST